MDKLVIITLFSTHSPIFKLFHRVWPLLYHSVYTVLYKTQRLQARRRAKLGESKIATKFADKILSSASIASNAMAIRIYVSSTVPTCKMSPLFFL